MPQYKFHFKKETVAAGSTSISVKTIVRSTRGIPDGVYHAFPKQLQGIDQHTELLQIGTIKSQLTSIANLRNIAVTLKEPVESLYVDGEGNFVFKNTPLDECDDPNIQERKQPQPTGVESPNGTVADLMKRIRELESLQRETNRMSIKRAKDHFAIGDFDGKTDGAEYLVKFESECQRYEVQTDEEKIKVLGDFCKGRAAVWWATNEKMTDKIWVNWSASFKSTFGQKGWPAVRAAHAYRYQPGRSIIEYALEKQRLFADINPKKGKRRVIISEALGQELLRRAHKKFGHIGAAAMLSTLRPHWYFKKMDEAAKLYAGGCQVCRMNKSRTKRRSGLLEKLGPPKRPYQVMSLDTVGGFAGNNSTKRYLHILVDHFSKFAWTATSTGQCTTDFVNLIKRVTDKNQITILLVDQYAGINTRELKDHLKREEVKLLFTAADHASSNGNVERLGQTMLNRIRCKFNDGNERRSWAVSANECTAEYNSTVHSVTGFAPEYLLAGVEPKVCPVPTLARDLEEDRKTAFERLMRDHERNKRRIDKNRTEEPIDVGDIVYADAGNKISRNKLRPLREGPFRVAKRRSPLMFELNRSGRRMNLYHKNQLSKIS